jgi:hypothetical protein
MSPTRRLLPIALWVPLQILNRHVLAESVSAKQ